MNRKTNVLVFPSATYPAMQIIDCLKGSLRFHVIAGASYGNHAEFVCSDCVTDLPYLCDSGFFDCFTTLIKERDIEFVIPTDETAAMYLKERERDLGAVVVCSPYETTVLCRHKALTYEVLSDLPFVPKRYTLEELDQTGEFPVFVKPDSGQGSKGSRIVHSCAEFAFVEDLDQCVICEYLPGEEYTVDCFTDRTGKLIYCGPRTRSRLMNGITSRGSTIPLDDEFASVVNGLNERIRFRGYWYVQLKRDCEGRLKLLEICTRFAGSFAISKGRGVNLPLMALCDFSGMRSDAMVNDYRVTCDKTYIDRYSSDLQYNHIYVDYDDTITCEDGRAVNPHVIAYLYQCRRKGIRIILVTRHEDTFGEPLCASFERLCIAPTLFDEIIELKWGQSKVGAIIDPCGGIFLDNSFAEREEVHNAYGMSVFDVCNIDFLFDCRA